MEVFVVKSFNATLIFCVADITSKIYWRMKSYFIQKKMQGLRFRQGEPCLFLYFCRAAAEQKFEFGLRGEELNV